MEVISQFWGALAAIAGLTIIGGLGLLRWRRRRKDRVGRALQTISVQRLDDILLPDGMGGQIHVAHLLLTAHGLVVIDVKHFRGMVFGSDRMEEWTVMAERRRFTFPNPQAALYDRVAALRQLVRDVPVHGHVLFDLGADFTKGRPKHVVYPAELQELYPKPPPGELERLIESFAMHWERVKEAARPAAQP